MTGIDGLRVKLLAVLVAFALVPMVIMGIISLVEMNQASLNVQSNIISLSTSLNRSALAVGQADADQVQLAIAKARQYDEFFGRIASENELVARYASVGYANESCTPPGTWVAPTGSNQTTSVRRDATVRSLCTPARIMKELHKTKSSSYLSYIGTEDGVTAIKPSAIQRHSATRTWRIILRPGRRRKQSGLLPIWMVMVIMQSQLPLPSLGEMNLQALREWMYPCIRFTATCHL